jgi:hypothetical protein
MSSEGSSREPWVLTDEEWCELCFMIMDLEVARDALRQTLLTDERPTLHQLWTALSAYRDSSSSLFDYVAERLRVKAGIHPQRAA